MALSALANVSEDINRGGRVGFYWLPASTRYLRVSSRDLIDDNLIYEISSGLLYSAAGDCVLVMTSSAPLFDYQGPFMQMSSGSGATLVENNFGAHGFDNAAASMLLIATNRGPEVRLSFRGVFQDRWTQELSNLLPSNATANGAPILTWLMFPVPSTVPLSSDHTYLRVFQALDVVVNVLPGISYHYDAGIGYYFFLYVDVTKRLKALVAGYDVWVQDGYYHDAVYEALKLKVSGFVPTLNSKLAAELSVFSGVPLTDVYYLPGDQTTPVPSIFRGHTHDDITIVLQRE